VIYLATPYSHPDLNVMEARFKRACELSAKLMSAGMIIFCPIAHTHPIAVVGELPRGWEFWNKFDHEFIQASEKVIVARMDGWLESKGVQAEIKIANELGKPVEYWDEEQIMSVT
jgi:hypothetical protein